MAQAAGVWRSYLKGTGAKSRGSPIEAVFERLVCGIMAWELGPQILRMQQTFGEYVFFRGASMVPKWRMSFF